MVSCRFPRTAAPPGETAPDDSYFIANPPPADLDKAVKQATEFIDYHIATGRRVVLVTSGGTIVPLEKRMVRFIDNFSAGTRGAVCRSSCPT